jgi:hypothetical protein
VDILVIIDYIVDIRNGMVRSNEELKYLQISDYIMTFSIYYFESFKDELTDKTLDEIIKNLTKILYGSERLKDNKIDINNEYYHSDRFIHATRLDNSYYFGDDISILGMQIVPIITHNNPDIQDQVYTSAENIGYEFADYKKLNKCKILLLMNYLKLYYGVKYFISVDCPNDYEQELWEKLTYHTDRNPNIFRCFYIKDMFSHTLNEAVFLADRILEYGDNMVFHCYAGFGRTGTVTLFTYILLNLNSMLGEYAVSTADDRYELVSLVKTFLRLMYDMETLKEFTNNIYPNNFNPNVSGIPANEIFNHAIRDPDDILYYNNLLNHRINAMYVAIIHAITNKYKGAEFKWLNEIPVVLTYFDPVEYGDLDIIDDTMIKNSTKKILTKFSIDAIQTKMQHTLATTYLTIDNFFYIKPVGETEFNGSTEKYTDNSKYSGSYPEIEKLNKMKSKS